MALTIQNVDGEAAYASVAAINSLRRAITEELTTKSHADVTSTPSGNWQAPTSAALQVTAANASDLATLRTLCRDLWSVGRNHFTDAVAHKAADATNVWGDQPATDAPLADLQTWLTARKTAVAAHFVQSGVHFTNDTTRTIASADATDLATSNTLANELKTDLNAHISAAFGGASIRFA